MRRKVRDTLSFQQETQYIRNKVLEVAKNFAGSNLKFVISNEEEFEEEIKSLGFEVYNLIK